MDGEAVAGEVGRIEPSTAGGAELSGGVPSSPRTVHAVYGNVLGTGGIAYILTELFDNLRPPFRPQVWYVQGDADPRWKRAYHRPALPSLVYRGLCKAGVPMAWQIRWVAERAIRNIKSGEIAYIWPSYTEAAIHGAKRRGAVVIAERINCMDPMCKATLERAFARTGRPLPADACLPEAMERERVLMSACDFVTAPGPFVTQSLLDSGIPAARIIETSYGWSPSRLAGAVDLQRPQRPPVFLFVGYGIFRKGLDLLLEAWEKANIEGRLVIAGKIEDDIRAGWARQLARPDVSHSGYQGDIASVYASADVFVFPTHEEGGPLVVYEAAGSGLPSLVSPMGAGRLVRHGQEGYVIDPYDTDAWVDAIRELARDVTLRQRLGAAAATRAKEFTWDRVARRLQDKIMAATS
jgi:glycosyltransferase involved in cell wall biosynthesis